MKTVFFAVFSFLVSILSNQLVASEKALEKPEAVAERLRNDAQRAENKGDDQRANDARNAAEHAKSTDIDDARETEREYNRGSEQ